MQFSNNAQTSLTANVTSGATTINVASAAGFPASAPYPIIIGTEYLLVTGGATTTTWTVQRAYDGSAAAAHSSGDLVTDIITVASLQAFIDQRIPAFTGTGTRYSGAWCNVTQSFPSPGGQYVPLNQVDSNVGDPSGMFRPASFAIYAPVKGLYQVSGRLAVSPPSGTIDTVAAIGKALASAPNTFSLALRGTEASGDSGNQSGSVITGILALQQGDGVALQCNYINPTGNLVNLQGQNYLHVFLIQVLP